MDVASPRGDANFTNDGDSRIAHHLILTVGQSHRRRDRDRITRVHTHRIEVLDRADDDDVVVVVAHHLELELLPADHAAFDEDLPRRRLVETTTHHFLEFGPIIGDTAARAA